MKTASQLPVFFLVDGPDSLKPPQLRFLPEVPPTATNLSALIHLKPTLRPTVVTIQACESALQDLDNNR